MKPRLWIGTLLCIGLLESSPAQPTHEEGLTQAAALFEAYQRYDKEGNAEGLSSLISNYASMTVETPQGSHKIQAQDYKEILRGAPSPWVHHHISLPRDCLLGTDYSYSNVQFSTRGERAHISARRTPKNRPEDNPQPFSLTVGQTALGKWYILEASLVAP